MHIQLLKAIPAAGLALLVAVLPAAAEDGVSADKIIFGQAAALRGPAGALGQGMKIGMEAAFAEVNKVGGVGGRKLELKSVDDGYEPTQSIEAVKKLLADDKVFAIAGPVASDQGSRRDQDRDHVPGRRVRPSRPRRREAGARQAQDGTRRRGHVRA